MAEYNEVISGLPYFGSVRFYSYLVQKDLIIDLHEHYEKQSSRNRTVLCGSQGTFKLSIPVHRPSGKKISMKDVQVAYDEDWRHDHKRAILSSYGSSPFFIYYWDRIQEFYGKKYDLLCEWNMKAHELVAGLLKMETGLRISDSYIESTPGIDLRPHMKKDAFNNERYIQVFEERIGFQPNMSILDLLFCMGPASMVYLERQELYTGP